MHTGKMAFFAAMSLGYCKIILTNIRISNKEVKLKAMTDAEKGQRRIMAARRSNRYLM